MSEQQENLSPELAPMSALPDMPRFYTAWRRRVHEWIARYSREELADAVLFVPDLAALLLRLLSDSRTPLFFKSQLLLAAIYILLPIDFVPEAVMGAAGLADDAVVASLVLMKLLQSARNLDPQLLRELWPGKGDVVATIQEVVESSGEIVNTRTWKRIRMLFGSPSPEPAVVHGKLGE